MPSYALHSQLWSGIIVNSEVMRRHIEPFHCPAKTFVIKNGVPVDDIKDSESVDLKGNTNLLFSGRLLHIKGVDLLLHAFQLISKKKKGTRLYIAGSGPNENMYKAMANELNISQDVTFLGNLPLAECYKLYKSCSALILPSRFESCPMTLLEGMAAGIPMVATRVGGTPEIFEHGRNGFLCSNNPADIAEKTLNIIDNPDLAQSFRLNNIVDSEKYSWKKIAQNYIDLYDSFAN